MDALIGGEGAHVGEGKTVVDDIKANYEKAVTDEFLKPVTTDILFFFNYRSDRMHARARYVLVLPDKPMEVTIPKNLAVTNVPAEWLAKQAHVAETEKYAHLTFFFKGGIEKHLMQRSGVWWIHQRWVFRTLPDFIVVATYDLQSGMTVRSCCAIFFLYFLLGSTFWIWICVAVKAISATDQAVGTIAAACHDAGYILITADHRNPETGRTCGAVPFILVGGKEGEYTLKDDEKDGKEKTVGSEEGEEEEEGALCDAAPTMLELIGLPKPEGASFLVTPVLFGVLAIFLRGSSELVVCIIIQAL
ncbi:hypothetical protein K438DRAFT_2026510 [Mycena galopus ATCC 62051]|nr:hypothetical protein K438DRAFT_2026510 [Mycena galopus ATCC 62051]